MAGTKKSGIVKPEWTPREEDGWFKSPIASHMREYMVSRNKATVFIVNNEAAMREVMLHLVEFTQPGPTPAIEWKAMNRW